MTTWDVFTGSPRRAARRPGRAASSAVRFKPSFRILFNRAPAGAEDTW
jgi:hypothetical protein